MHLLWYCCIITHTHNKIHILTCDYLLNSAWEKRSNYHHGLNNGGCLSDSCSRRSSSHFYSMFYCETGHIFAAVQAWGDQRQRTSTHTTICSLHPHVLVTLGSKLFVSWYPLRTTYRDVVYSAAAESHSKTPPQVNGLPIKSKVRRSNRPVQVLLVNRVCITSSPLLTSFHTRPTRYNKNQSTGLIFFSSWVLFIRTWREWKENGITNASGWYAKSKSPCCHREAEMKTDRW